jgi:hypothetical protein
MRLREAVSEADAARLAAGGACDRLETFAAAVDAADATLAPAALWAQAHGLAADLEDRAQTGYTADPEAPAAAAIAPVLCGQQAYVDYRLGMLAKLDALERCRPPALAAFVEYDGFASDRLHTRTDLAGVAPGGPDRLTLIFHRGRRANGRKDLRFVAAPDEATLARIRADLRGAITMTARAVAGFDASAAREQLDLLCSDHAVARENARSAGEFNLLWTARVLRRLGFRVPLLALGELWGLPSVRAVVARTLVPFLHDNAAFVEAANAALGRSRAKAPGMSPRPPGHLPLMLSDDRGVRHSVHVRRRGEDFVLGSDTDVSFRVNVGRGGEHELRDFLEVHGDRCTPNVFAPIFLFQAGCAGMVNGRGAIRYALVIAAVLRRLFARAPPPNLLCAGELRRDDPFAAARAAIAGAPAGVEPALVARLLATGPAGVRREIAEAWRDEP